MSALAAVVTDELGSDFAELEPRPPVPGKEEGLRENEPNGGKRVAPRGAWGDRDSPVATPRRSLLDPGGTTGKPVTTTTTTTTTTETMEGKGKDVGEAPLGFEPEGSASTTPPFAETPATPPYLRWAASMRNLLDDAEGVEQFRSFLRQENAENLLMFWFAIKSLKMMEDGVRIAQLTKVIYRTYIRAHGEQTLAIRPDVRRAVAERFSTKVADRNIFDCAQCEIEQLLEGAMYPQFLKSDVYLQSVRAAGDASPKVAPASGGDDSSLPAGAALWWRPRKEGAGVLLPADVEVPPPARFLLSGGYWGWRPKREAGGVLPREDVEVPSS
ncbi:PREDICTED: axin-1-like [Priapulus caudatus]|uniref:Axin-1-like n=1 Tax=Priapulus caudatus TaxID=37621 RepID=A0ABM1E8W1_PRICU|nr:PREDICTED: axin-1-like [Priapulus caudatus]